MAPWKRVVVMALAAPLVAWHWLVEPLAPGFRRLRAFARLRAAAGAGIPASTQLDGTVEIEGTRRVTLGEHCRIGPGVFLETQEQGAIRIGRHVRLNRGTVIVAWSGITIGDDCLIGEYVSLRDANHGSSPGTSMRLQPHDAKPIAIGDDVWIGRGAVVLPGVQIGSGAVIGANSVVTADVPAGAVAAGVPARVIRQREGG
jgi:acetyltransferase-like isoleucine patch superfamily enzyme